MSSATPNGTQDQEHSHRFAAGSAVVITPFQLLFLSGTLGAIALSVWTAVESRPIADDYCVASIVGEGLHQQVLVGVASAGGAVVQYLVYGVLVGLPLNYLPWGMTGIGSFAGLAIAVVCTWLVILYKSDGVGKLSRAQILLGSITLALCWPVLWVVNGLLSYLVSQWVSGSTLLLWPVQQMFTFVTWYTLHANIAMTIALGWLLVLVGRSFGSPRRGTLFAIAVGAIIGLSGPQYAAMASTTVVVWMAVAPLRRMMNGHTQRYWLVALTIAISGGLSLLTPGVRNRTASLDPQIRELAPSGVAEFVFIKGSLEWGILLLSPGMMAIILVVVAWKTFVGVPVNSRKVRDFGSGLILVSYVSCLVTKFSELFAYEAFWHQFPWAILLFFGVTMVTVGTAFPEKAPGPTSNVLLALATTCLILTYVVLGVISADRQREWESGPATIGWIADIAPDGFAYECWREWKRHDKPSRPLEALEAI